MAINEYIPSSDKKIHKTSVDFILRNCAREIHIVQYDKSQPIVEVELYNCGLRYTLPANAVMNLRFSKPDKTFVYKSVLGCNKDRNTVYFDIDEQMSFLYGKVNPILELLLDDMRAGSSPIPIEIDRNPIQNEDLESSSEYPAIVEAANKAVEAASRAETSANNAAEAVANIDSKLVDLENLKKQVGNDTDEPSTDGSLCSRIKQLQVDVANAGKIDVVKVNGVPLEVVDKAVNITIPAADSVVKSLDGAKGDVKLKVEGYLSKSFDSATNTITLLTNFTPEQKTAIDSGITADKVQKYDGYDARITAAKNAADVAASDLKAYITLNDAAVAKKVDKTTTVNGHALSTDVIITKADVGLGNVENKPLDTAVSAHSDHYITSGAVKTYVDGLVTGSVQYLGTVASIAELNSLSPDSPGDFCRVSSAFGSYHAGDLLLCKTIPSGSTAATWDVIHGEIDKDTWVANSATADGYVAKGNGHANKVWKTDANGVPAWRDDDNTHQDISNLVPYTGATKDINIGGHRITTARKALTDNDTQVQFTPDWISLINPSYGVDISADAIRVKRRVNDSATNRVLEWPSAEGQRDTIATIGDITSHAGIDKVGTVTKVTAGTGLKITGTATVTPNVEIDEATTFIFDCGSSTENI